MKYLNRFRVHPGDKVRLKDIDPGFKDHHESHKKAAEEIERDREKLRALQALLYADGRCSLLICLQGLDAGGKDGTISHILGAMNPQGCRVTGFRQPSTEEQAHDFLWRIHRATPARGQVAIFNRSHYEDVLVVRVHKLVPRAVWSRRYDQINDVREGARREQYAHSQVLPPHLQERAAETVRGPARRSHEAMEDQRVRLQGARVLGRLHGGLRGGPVSLQHAACALVRHPVRPQVVSQPGDCADRRGTSGGAGHEAPRALGRPGAHSPRVSRGEGRGRRRSRD